MLLLFCLTVITIIIISMIIIIAIIIITTYSYRYIFIVILIIVLISYVSEINYLSIYLSISQPRTSDRLTCHWRALCPLAYDNWRCSIQPEIFHSLKVPNPSRDSISDRQQETSIIFTCNLAA